MSITQASIETAVEAAVTAMDASDWVAARLYAVKIRMYLMAMPDFGQSDMNLRYDRQAVDKILAAIDAAEADEARGANPIIHGSLRYVDR